MGKITCFIFLILICFLNLCAKIICINPDIIFDTPELIQSRGFECQTHWVTTEDGYVLTIFRIINPYWKSKAKRKPVLLWHQLASNSNSYLVSTRGQLDNNGTYSERNGTLINNCRDSLTSNLAFTLSACGWDVWLGNTRGNRYSGEHIEHSFLSEKFWDYSFTELAIYDTKNTIEYILEITSEDSVAYIGSSMGTTQMFVLLSLKPEMQKQIRPFIAIPPIVYLSNTRTFLTKLAFVARFVNNLKIGMGQPQEVSQAIGLIASMDWVGIVLESAISLVTGNNEYSIDQDTLPAMVANYMDFTSSKVVLHYCQFILSGRFHHFDYLNTTANHQIYSEETAPDYPINKISPNNLVLFLGRNDLLCDSKDVDTLLSKVKVNQTYIVEDDNWNHLDFIFSSKANKYLNGKIIDHLRIKA